MKITAQPKAQLNSPYGGSLVDLVVSPERAAEMKATAKDLASLTLDERGLCDLELLGVGGFSPLAGFLGKADYERVVAEMRLADGTLWPLPVTLPVTPGDGVAEGKPLALRDVYGNLLAFLHVEEIYPIDKNREAEHAYGSLDAKHPAVAYLDRQPGHYAAGRLEVIRIPPHYDFVELRRTPAELRQHFQSLGWTRIVAFQTRNPLHRAHEELTKRAAEQIGGGLLIHPVVGVTKPGDVDHFTRVRCYRALVDNYYEPRIGRAQPAAAGHADGRPARGAAARDHPPQLRLHPLHRRPRPRRARQRLDRQAVLFALCRPGVDGQVRGRDRHGDGRLQADGLPARREPLLPGRRGSRRAPRRPTSPAPRSATSTWPRAPAPRVVQPAGRGRDPRTRPIRPGSARG